MKFRIDGYEIEIKAKNTNMGNERFNKHDTMSLLNLIAIWTRNAAEYHRELSGYNALAEEASEVTDEIHEQLERAGLYKGLDH